MAAMPYLAIYAASAAFWRDHRDWSLRDATGMPIPFGDDFLGLMDPSPGASWAGHLMGECARALSELPFDGLHIDQYGEPKLAWNARAEPVDLPAAFAAFVAAAKARFPGRTVLFNAVGNWPIEALAPSATDFNYIEVWPPRTRFGHLAEIVRDARRLSGGKPVVIALYLPANRPATVLLADALILACGGARIELGEGDRLLADPYFPNHQALSLELSRSLRRFYDFAVRYGEWIGPAAEDVDELIVELPAEIRAVGRAAAGRLILHLINFTGLDPDPSWDQAQPFPSAVREVGVRIRLRAGPERVWWATPEEPRVQSLPFRYEDGWLSFEAPALAIWGFAAIEGG